MVSSSLSNPEDGSTSKAIRDLVISQFCNSIISGSYQGIALAIPTVFEDRCPFRGCPSDGGILPQPTDGEPGVPARPPAAGTRDAGRAERPSLHRMPRLQVTFVTCP